MYNATISGSEKSYRNPRLSDRVNDCVIVYWTCWNRVSQPGLYNYNSKIHQNIKTNTNMTSFPGCELNSQCLLWFLWHGQVPFAVIFCDGLNLSIGCFLLFIFHVESRVAETLLSNIKATWGLIRCVIMRSVGILMRKYNYILAKQLEFKGILWDFFIFTLEQIIVLNKYCT